MARRRWPPSLIPPAEIPDRQHGPAGNELLKVETLVQADHHVVHAPRQFADLVMRAHTL